MKILEQENGHLHKLLELTDYGSGTAAITGGVIPGILPNPIMNGDGGRGKFAAFISSYRCQLEI